MDQFFLEHGYPMEVKIKFDNEEERRQFTDSNGVVHSAYFLDKDTGKPVLP